MGKRVELQSTHIVLFKQLRDVLRIKTFSQQFGLGSSLKEYYQDAKSIPYGNLLIDLTRNTVDLLRLCTNSGSVPSKFYLPEGTETKFLDNEQIIRLYTPNILNNFPKNSKTVYTPLSKKCQSVPQRMPIKLATRQKLEVVK